MISQMVKADSYKLLYIRIFHIICITLDKSAFSIELYTDNV